MARQASVRTPRPRGALRHRRPGDAAAETGQIGLLILGLCVVVLTVVVGVLDVTAVQLARVRVYDVADAAALHAADALAENDYYRAGLDARVPLSEAGVRERATRYLAATQRPDRVAAWRLDDPTGTADGHAATVAVTATIEVPLGDALIASVFGPVTVTTVSTAEARLDAAAPPAAPAALPAAPR